VICPALLDTLNAYFWGMALVVWLAVGVWAWITYRRQ
jgi:hypothetical protein